MITNKINSLLGFYINCITVSTCNEALAHDRQHVSRCVTGTFLSDTLSLNPKSDSQRFDRISIATAWRQLDETAWFSHQYSVDDISLPTSSSHGPKQPSCQVCLPGLDMNWCLCFHECNWRNPLFLDVTLRSWPSFKKCWVQRWGQSNISGATDSTVMYDHHISHCTTHLCFTLGTMSGLYDEETSWTVSYDG